MLQNSLGASACNADTTATQPHRNSNTHRTKNDMTSVVIQQNSLKLLMMDILMSETCWAHKKWNKIASDIKLVFYSSTRGYVHRCVRAVVNNVILQVCLWRCFVSSFWNQTWIIKGLRVSTTTSLPSQWNILGVGLFPAAGLVLHCHVHVSLGKDTHIQPWFFVLFVSLYLNLVAFEHR